MPSFSLEGRQTHTRDRVLFWRQENGKLLFSGAVSPPPPRATECHLRRVSLFRRAIFPPAPVAILAPFMKGPFYPRLLFLFLHGRASRWALWTLSQFLFLFSLDYDHVPYAMFLPLSQRFPLQGLPLSSRSNEPFFRSFFRIAHR